MTRLWEKRQGSETDQPLPDYLSYSAYSTAANGERQYTVVLLPQTYYGPSIPLGTDGVYVYGGPTSPADNAAAAPTDPASILASVASQASAAVTALPETTDPAFLSTFSEASVRSTSLAEEITSAFSQLSIAEQASQSVESFFSEVSSSVSMQSTASTESTQSTASAQSVASVSMTSAIIASLSSRRESRSSTRSVESTASVVSRESTSSTASAASLTSLASAASVASVSSISRTSAIAQSTESTASAASVSSLSHISQSSQSVISTASASSSTPTAIAAGSTSFPTRNIIALAIGLFFALLLIALILICLFRWRQRRNRSLVPQQRIPAERSHSVHQSMFFGRGGPSDGRVNVQGTVFDLWTPEQRAARENAQQRRSVSSWAGRTLALITGTYGSRGSAGSGSGGSGRSRGTGSSRIGIARKVSRTAAEDGLLEEETPLVGHNSPPLSPPPFHSPPAAGGGGRVVPLPTVREPSFLSPVVPPFAAVRDSGSFSTPSAVHSANQSRLTLPLSMASRPESPGDGEHETAELLVARRVTRSPSPKMGRLSWFMRMGLIGGGGPSTSSQEGHASMTEVGPTAESEAEFAPPEMSEIRTEGGTSLKSWLEMGGNAHSFPQPPPLPPLPNQPHPRQPTSLSTPQNGARPISTISTNSVYHDALSDLPPTSSRPGTPSYTAIPAPPAPSTPPRRRPVPFVSHHRIIASGSLPGSRTDLLDSPVPSPLRRSFNAGTGSPPSAWSKQPYSPDLEDELQPPPATAWRNSRGSEEMASPIDLGPSAERKEEPHRSGGIKRFTFGYPILTDAPQPPQRVRDGEHGPFHSLPAGAAPPKVRDSMTHFDTLSSRGAASFDNPSLTADTSFNASTPTTTTPRSSLAPSHKGVTLRGLGLEDPVPMAFSACGKPKTRAGRPATPSNTSGTRVDSSGR
ncbi:hypothetical protein DACRYDRAFT_20527 [Dacryopinax primogenitus]|uniref:Uncharacterized protein n=1 Tax=Dacryopinax primogenitus (strain DJM 731) TaxID=1858805 RepID=M5GG66_DACPD|nr:uncharacterized protein DACRYDRAFT_20527 [Dacryopinax primogenitus]EJU04953.1 hypothetical protein DACRYDRAFT_20527 [Dacryopinax primogenitus]